MGEINLENNPVFRKMLEDAVNDYKENRNQKNHFTDVKQEKKDNWGTTVSSYLNGNYFLFGTWLGDEKKKHISIWFTTDERNIEKEKVVNPDFAKKLKCLAENNSSKDNNIEVIYKNNGEDAGCVWFSRRNEIYDEIASNETLENKKKILSDFFADVMDLISKE